MDDQLLPEAHRARVDYDGPISDQKKRREAGRIKDLALQCYQREQISEPQYRAAWKLYMHLVGREGARVHYDDEMASPLNTDTEYPQIYHGQKIAAARAAVASSQTWIVLEMFVGATPQPDGTPAKLADIGSAASGLKCPKMARGYALGVVGAGLDVLVKHWGLK